MRIDLLSDNFSMQVFPEDDVQPLSVFLVQHGRDAAGINSLPYLDRFTVAGATVDHKSARIGDGASMAATGIISYVNETARAAGCVQGLTAMECARAMLTAPIRANLCKR